MIIDTFIFFNEIELLDIRLNILNDCVDRFVLVEATKTFQGKPKSLYFEDNKQKFSKFKDKIIHVIVDDLPVDSAPFDREYIQRDAILRGLHGCSAKDLIILSDLDEIPNPEVIPKSLEQGRVGLFNQKLFYYSLNTKCVELDMLPCSLIVNFMELGSPAVLRKRIVAYHSAMLSKAELDPCIKIIENGGWHFSYLGSPETIVTKIEAFSHDELNVDEFKNIQNIKASIASGSDIFGRELSFVTAVIEELPKYIVENFSMYKEKGLLDFSLGKSEKIISIDLTASKALPIIFDQYSRYKACSDLILQTGFAAGDAVLDIGSGPECLFGGFLPDAVMNYVDPLIPISSGQGRVTGNIFASELDGKSFACVTAVDVLEHVPPEFRAQFLNRMSALGNNTLILGFPASDAGDALTADRDIDDQYRSIFGHDYSWLEEHHKYGLPSLAGTVDHLAALGWHCQIVGHGHVPWLKELLGFVICAWEIPALKPIVLQASEKFNHDLYSFDFRAPHYRQFVVATRRPLPAITQPVRANSEAEADSIFRKLMDETLHQYFAVSLQQLAVHDSAVTERDSAVTERDSAVTERDTAVTERDSAVALANLMQQSASWRLTRPLRFAARLARYGFTNEDRQRLTQALRQRYHQLPLPAPAKRLASFAYHKVLVKTVQALRRRFLSVSQFHAPSIKPAANAYNTPDYIFWGVIDWHYRHQRPQQLAVALTNTGRRVFYISPNFTDDERAGFEVEVLDDAGLLFQVKLFVKGAPVIYSSAPSVKTIAQLRASIGEVLEWADSKQIISMVDHPFWYDIATVLPNSRLIYDCMDHHEGFGNNAESLMQLEKTLLSTADITITTSSWLDNAVAPHARRRALIRNAGDYDHFCRAPDSVYRDPQGRRIIGYYGAIAEWFDMNLVEAVAKQHPECCVLLIGADTVNARARLAKLPNVTFTGEVLYSQLSYYLYSFDVCLLPFKVIPLTLATNPVKAYEYLSAGKPVVAVDLPEMVQFEGLVYVAADREAFLAAVGNVLSQPEPDALVQQRKAFAQGQTWRHRAEELMQQAESAAFDPNVSVIVVTYNNLDFTRACLASLDEYSQYENIEIIVVDNASSDGSPAFLSDWVVGESNRKLILNGDNRGFAAANNQGLEIATGDYLVMLNNDTYVTPGWVRTLVRHLERDKTIGLIGPVTNNIGNEAKIDIAYSNMAEMLLKSAAFTRRHVGQTFPLRTAAFFCVMMPRTTYSRVGTLDEIFGRGFFEDDDYCRRIEQLGLRVVCAEDVFIHHELSASFDQLRQQDRQKLFEDNKKIYEAKWGGWVPHGYRSHEPPALWQPEAIPDVFSGQK